MARGEIVVPAQLRYQACNDTICFRAEDGGRRVDAAGRARERARARRSTRTSSTASRSDAARHPASPAPAPVSADGSRTRADPQPPTRSDRGQPRRLRRSSAVRTSAAIWAPSDFLKFSPQRRERRAGARAVRGSRAAGDPADRLPRRPGAEPDAVRPADDSDQPGDHRRRLAERARARAASCSAAPTAPRWPWSTACSASSSS